jgi:hypothetical protein
LDWQTKFRLDDMTPYERGALVEQNDQDGSLPSVA